MLKVGVPVCSAEDISQPQDDIIKFFDTLGASGELAIANVVAEM